MPASLSQAVKAGNIGDIFKHACLIELFQKVSNQPGPRLTYVESHGGYASYLASTLKVGGRLAGERQWGLGGLLLSPTGQADGLRLLVDHVRKDDTYPGSPTLALRYLPQDAALIFYELLDRDAASSIREAARRFGRQGSVEVRESDGFVGVRQHLTQASDSTGTLLMFVDPWYREASEKHDWAAALEILRMGKNKSASTVVWFPKKLRNKPFPPENDLDQLTAQGISRAEVWFEDARRISPWADQDLAGCGLLWVNVPGLSAITERIGQELKEKFAGTRSENGRELDLTFLGNSVPGTEGTGKRKPENIQIVPPT